MSFTVRMVYLAASVTAAPLIPSFTMHSRRSSNSSRTPGLSFRSHHGDRTILHTDVMQFLSDWCETRFAIQLDPVDCAVFCVFIGVVVVGTCLFLATIFVLVRRRGDMFARQAALFRGPTEEVLFDAEV